MARASTNGTPARRSTRAASQSSPLGTPAIRSRSSGAGSASKSKTAVQKKRGREEESEEEEDEDSADEESNFSEEESEQEESSDDFEEEDEATPPPKKKSKKGPQSAEKKGRQSTGSANELWREGVATDLEPGKEVFIALPKARDPGKTPYKDDRLHKNTFLFLKDLKKNNDRGWLKAHDADFRQSQRDFSSFVENLSEELMKHDETIPELPPKDAIFRIYRDVRFSKDQTPYKSHFSAAWSRTGKSGPYACYYLHVEPGRCYAAGGLWCPEAASLALMRRAIDRRSEVLKQVLMGDIIRKDYLNVPKADENSVVKAFAKVNAEYSLKIKPKGYTDDNPNLTLLRLKSYIMTCKLSEEDFCGPNTLEKVGAALGKLEPFVTYLNSIVMPDDAPSSDDSDGEESE